MKSTPDISLKDRLALAFEIANLVALRADTLTLDDIQKLAAILDARIRFDIAPEEMPASGKKGSKS